MASTDLQVIEHGAHTVEIRESDERKAIALMDRMDLDQAMGELRGEVVEKFVYVAKGKRQLSYLGIKEAARLYRNVHFGATATPVDGGWMINSYAHNLADNTRVDYPMPYPAFNPSNPEESITFRATLSKSLRNALAAVLPVTYLETMISRWIEQQSGGSGQRTQQRTVTVHEPTNGQTRGQQQAQPAISEPAEAAERRRFAERIKDQPNILAWMKSKGYDVNTAAITWVREQTAKMDARGTDRALTLPESPVMPAATAQAWTDSIGHARSWINAVATRSDARPLASDIVTGKPLLLHQWSLIGYQGKLNTLSQPQIVAEIKRCYALMVARLDDQVADDEADENEAMDAELNAPDLHDDEDPVLAQASQDRLTELESDDDDPENIPF